MGFKILIMVILALSIISLGKALFHLSSTKPTDSIKMLEALRVRIGLSVLLFVLLIIAYTLGLIDPQRGP